MKDLQFGDIILYQEDYYVFLATTKSILYLAKIFSKYNSKKLKNKIDMMLAKGIIDTSTTLLAYITLTTDDFEDRMCSAAQPDMDLYNVLYLTKTKFKLSAEDKKSLKVMIKNGETSVSLREEIEKLS